MPTRRGPSLPESEAPQIRPAADGEAGLLREIAIEAKGHWGYDRAWVESWAHSEDFQASGLEGRETYVAELDGRIVAWTSAGWKDGTWWMDDLWVRPSSMGLGIGASLFAHVVARGRELGSTTLEWEAEPNALGFYERMGGRHVRNSEPTSWSRSLPIYAIELGEPRI
jgi:GNAT superfamily N-acetyltransferase